MKKRISILLVMSLLVLSSTAFASNWVYYGRSGLVPGNLYIDADSVMKNGDNLSYWELLVYDKLYFKVAKLMTKYEVILAPSRKYRIADSRYYNADNRDDKEMSELNDTDTTTGKWSDSFVGANMSADTDFALKYAKDGKDTGQRPTLP